MGSKQKSMIMEQITWQEFNAKANHAICTYLMYLLLVGAWVNFCIQYFALGQSLDHAVIMGLISLLLAAWSGALGKMKLTARLKSHLISATVFVAIPFCVLQYRDHMSFSMWALPLLFMLPAIIYTGRTLMIYLMASTLFTEVFLWASAGNISVALTYSDYAVRALILVGALTLTFFINRAYIKGQQESMRTFYYDTLTNLPNRALFYKRLSQTMLRCNQYNHKAALIMIDIDGFKTVNNTLGHMAGDKILVEVSKRIQHVVNTGGSASRLGGDEFALVLEDISDEGELIRIADKLQQTLSAPIPVGDHSISLGVSMGIVSIPEDDSTVQGIVRKADAAMYLSKSKGKGCYNFHSSEVELANQKKVIMIPKLNNALTNNEFRLYFQPQILRNEYGMRIVSLEALIRWEHPIEGIISPAEFISCAQDTGMIIPIGKWVIHEACKTIKFFELLGIELPISVNASVLQFHSETFIAETKAAIENTGISPQKLQIEITESIFIDGKGIKTLHRLKEMGIKIALDDFGTGYSCLSILRSLPIDFLKIDRTFVMNLHKKKEREIASTIVSMAQALDISVIAEGVETQEQLDVLVGMDCNLFQGFLFGRPMELTALLDLFYSTRLAI